jgi:hypothetical protein
LAAVVLDAVALLTLVLTATVFTAGLAAAGLIGFDRGETNGLGGRRWWRRWREPVQATVTVAATVWGLNEG